MKCVNCGTDKPMKPLKGAYQYEECGIKVTLKGVVQYECAVCGEHYVEIPFMENMLATLAHYLIRKPAKLSKDEVRFLRKYLGYAQDTFASQIEMSQAHLSRIENGKNEVPSTLDRLLRSMVAAKAPDRDYEFHEQFGRISKTPSNRTFFIELETKSKKWAGTKKTEAEMARARA